MQLNRAKAEHTAHKMHFLCHSMYLSAAVLEGHLIYSTAAGILLVVTIASAWLGRGEAG